MLFEADGQWGLGAQIGAVSTRPGLAVMAAVEIADRILMTSYKIAQLRPLIVVGHLYVIQRQRGYRMRRLVTACADGERDAGEGDSIRTRPDVNKTYVFRIPLLQAPC